MTASWSNRSPVLPATLRTASPPCGNCGNCRGEYQLQDITVPAQMILSCVHRVKSRLGYYVGKTLLVQVLRGSRTQRVAGLGLDQLSTYGLMSRLPAEQVRTLIDFLEAEGFLRTNPLHATLEPTPAAAKILFQGEKLSMPVRKDRAGEARRAGRKKTDSLAPETEDLFSALRAVRTRLAQEENVPAYVVFSNATLADMAEKAPRTMDEFLDVTGVGEVKAARYGEAAGADLIVMGARGLSALQNLYLGSVSLATIASSKCPVLVFRQTTEVKPGALRIGLSVDDSPFGPKCAEYLIAHRHFFGKDATFEIVNVVPDDPLYAPDFVNEGPIPPQMTWEEIQGLEFEASVKTPVEKFDIAGVPVKAVKLIGNPEDVLPKYADENLDVMVMGTHGKGALRSLVFGSSTRAMIAATNLPILVVPNS